MTEKLKIGDLVSCYYKIHCGIGYAKVLEITDKVTGESYQEYGPIIVGRGDKNSKINIKLQYVGYDLLDGNMENDLSEFIEVDEISAAGIHDVYRVVDEEMISKIKEKWDRLYKNKIDFFYKYVNKKPLEGRKSLNKLKIKS